MQTVEKLVYRVMVRDATGVVVMYYDIKNREELRESLLHEAKNLQPDWTVGFTEVTEITRKRKR